MKQVIVKGGQAIIEDVPAPVPKPGEVLVATEASCVSIGTEASGLNTSSQPLWQRALRHPDKALRFVRLVSEKGITYGMDLLRGNLAAGLAVGYSAAGVVIATGEEVKDIAPGDRVACAGTNYALHAEVVRVPRNLTCRLPAGLGFVDASTVALGSIALQGVRRLAPTLGELVVVFGLGLIGQVTVQLLRASGCRVVGVDPESSRTALALELGAERCFEEPGNVRFADTARMSDGAGADGVIVTAATRDASLLNTAFDLCRRRGRVVLVGDVPITIDRAAVYAKELDFLVSTSYGPGRYDSRYEEGGVDYPIGYVRWTENRNMQAYLELLAREQLRLAPLLEVVRPVEDAPGAYADMQAGSAHKPLAVVLTYDTAQPDLTRRKALPARTAAAGRALRVGIIGASGFVAQTHLPNMKQMPERFVVRAVCSTAGSHARHVGSLCAADYCTTDPAQILEDPQVDVVLIAGRHAGHSSQALAALEAGKHVFVEKPLVVEQSELDAFAGFFETRGEGGAPQLMTGFNRRFSPAMQRLAERLRTRSGPLVMSYRMNAGAIPQSHWVQGPEGGGRNIGEACHIYDLFTFLTGERRVGVRAQSIGVQDGSMLRNENFSVSLGFEDGSLAHLLYTSLGDTRWPKERLEAHCDGRTWVMDDYVSLRSAPDGSPIWQGSADKGHRAELEAFGRSLMQGDGWAIPFWQQQQATAISLEVERQIYPHE